MPRCEGRPSGPCPSKVNNASVTLCQGDLMLCKDCEIFRFPHLKVDKASTSAIASASHDMSSSTADTDVSGSLTDGIPPASMYNGAVTSEANLMQCELLYFMIGCYGQYPDSTVKTTILEFYREDEILHAKQVLIQAAEHIGECNTHSFTKKRTGNNKCKSSVDDIFNIVRVIDEHSLRDKLPTFCAVNRFRVPVIAEELSDMAAVRLELNQLRQLVESLANQLSSVTQSKHLHMGLSVVSNPTPCAVDVSEPAVIDAVNTVDIVPSSEMSSTSTSGNGAESLKNPTATFADRAKVLREDDFQEVKNKKKGKLPATKRLVIGDSVHDVGFKGIAKKSVFCVNRLERHTTVKAVEDYLKSKNIHVFSCFRVKPRSPAVAQNDDCDDVDDDDDDDDDERVKFVCMRICIAQYDSQKFMSSDIWPKGITVRPWVFKPKQNA